MDGPLRLDRIRWKRMIRTSVRLFVPHECTYTNVLLTERSGFVVAETPPLGDGSRRC